MGQRGTKVVLFLGTGSYHGSRFAETVFNQVAGKMGLPWKASSRGLALEGGTSPDSATAASAVQALQALGVRDTKDFTQLPGSLVAEDLDGAAWVVALNEEKDRPLLGERFPAHAEKAEYWQIVGGPEALALIEREVMDLVARLMSGGKPRQPRPQQEASEAARPDEQMKAEAAKAKGTVRVGRETKGRRGKGVTTVFDLSLDDDGVRELAALLKQRCGTGGTVKDGRIEIQGDQRERIVTELERLGYKVKRVGG
jgi:predicted translation initiation factor SUI1